MSVKLLLLKSGEEVITEVQEVFDPETKDPVGFKLHKPFRLDTVSYTHLTLPTICSV